LEALGEEETVARCGRGAPGGFQSRRARLLGHTDPHTTAVWRRVVDMAQKIPALFIPVKVG
jgi:hypothetical protein